jgi:hypothetical protein
MTDQGPLRENRCGRLLVAADLPDEAKALLRQHLIVVDGRRRALGGNPAPRQPALPAAALPPPPGRRATA